MPTSEIVANILKYVFAELAVILYFVGKAYKSSRNLKILITASSVMAAVLFVTCWIS